MRDIDLTDPAYRDLTKGEIRALKGFSREEKEALSMRVFGESLDPPRPQIQPPPLDVLIRKRWRALLEGDPAPPQYKIATHRALISNGRYYALHPRSSDGERVPTASGFVDWVRRLYIREVDPSALQAGIEGEIAAVDAFNWIEQTRLNLPRWEYQSWKLIHDGIRRPFRKAYEIPSLTVGEKILVGVPDLVFRERNTGKILIVEIKVSNARLQDDGWPNLRAQLWAYSRIGKWASAPEVLLAGEMWRPNPENPVRRHTYLWRRGDERLENESRELFTLFGGNDSDSG